MTSNQVTLELCQEVIDKQFTSCPNKKVLNFKIEEFRKSEFTQEYLLKVLVNNYSQKQLSFLLKLPEEQKEQLLYSILPREQKLAAKCFYSSENVMVFENLVEYGYDDCKNVFDDAHIKLALKRIAEFHALTRGTDLNENQILVSYLRASYLCLFEAAKGIPLKKHNRKEFEELLTTCFEKTVETLKPSKEFFNVVNHGDLRKENLLFQYKNGMPVDCKLKNFYFVHSSPPANDVVFFLLNALTTEASMKYYREYLEYYFSSLTKALENGNAIQWEDFDLSCKDLLPYNKLRNACFTLERKTETLMELEDLLTNAILSKEDCFAVLNQKLRSKNYTLNDFCITALEERTGFLGDHFILTTNILWKGRAQQISFFMKTLCAIPSQRRFTVETGAIFKEHNMFAKLMPLLEQNDIRALDDVVPKCYFARLNHIVVLEDLRKQGYVSVNPYVSLKLEDVTVAVKALAKLHAAFIILEERISKKEGIMYRLNQAFSKEFKESFYTDRIKVIVEAKEAFKSGARACLDVFHNEDVKMGKDSLFDLICKTIDRQEEHVKPSKRFRNTFTHGDLWINNLLFKFENGIANNCRIIDFQSYRYHPPARDLLCMLHLSTDRAFREKHLKQVLDVYFDQFADTFWNAGLDNVISRKEFDESCRFYRESVLCQTLTHFQLVMIPNDVNTHLFENPEELRRVVFEEKYEFIRELLERNPNFKRRNQEAFLDIVEYFESVSGGQ